MSGYCQLRMNLGFTNRIRVSKRLRGSEAHGAVHTYYTATSKISYGSPRQPEIGKASGAGVRCGKASPQLQRREGHTIRQDLRVMTANQRRVHRTAKYAEEAPRLIEPRVRSTGSQSNAWTDGVLCPSGGNAQAIDRCNTAYRLLHARHRIDATH